MRHHRPRLKLSPWLKRWIYTSALLLLLSGGAWLWLHYGPGSSADDLEGLPSPWEPWAMRLHGLASFAALLGLGAVAGQHIPPGWRMTREHSRAAQRKTGLILSGLAACTVLTAYGLYYLVPESLHAGFGLFHTGLGLLILAAWHWHRPSKD